MLARDPYVIGSCNLAAMHPAQLAQFYIPIRRLVGRTGEVRPARMSGKPLAVNFVSFVQSIEAAQAVDSLEENRSWFGCDLKRGDGGRSRGVREGLRGRLDNSDALPAE